MITSCAACDELRDEVVELRHRLRVALTGEHDGEIHRELPAYEINNPSRVRNHEGMQS